MADPYRILGVPHTASQEEIRSAYHRLARRYHPDLNPEPGSEARMRAINWAYETLSDPRRRARYDAPGWTPPPSYPPTSGSPYPPRPANGPVRPNLIWTSFLFWIMLTRTCLSMAEIIQPRPTYPPLQLDFPALTTMSAQVDRAPLDCLAWTGGISAQSPSPGCYYGAVFRMGVRENADWPYEFFIFGNTVQLHVLLKSGISMPSGITVNQCIVVKGDIVNQVDGLAEMRITRPDQLEPCP